MEYGTDAKSLEMAQEAVGFTIAFPESVKVENYIVIDKAILEIAFKGGYIRKQSGSGDVSGDCNKYANVAEKDVEGKKVTFKGNGNKIKLAIWENGGYTYCIGIPDGTGEAEMISYVDTIK